MRRIGDLSAQLQDHWIAAQIADIDLRHLCMHELSIPLVHRHRPRQEQGPRFKDNAALKLPHMDEAQLGAVGERRDGQVERQEK